jgi:1,4-alpha-glucan branching enzyme
MLQTDPDLVESIVDGSCGAPFDTLGIHPLGKSGGRGFVIRVFLPEATAAAVVRGDESLPMRRVHAEGFFELVLPEEEKPFTYRLAVTGEDGLVVERDDPYRFGPVLAQEDVEKIACGEDPRLDLRLGARPLEREGVAGILFAVWAPNAVRVGVMGSFNGWDGRRHPMRKRSPGGLWEIFIPGLWTGALYKYEIRTRHEGRCTTKADPVGFAMEMRPSTASIVWDLDGFEWNDAKWMKSRAKKQALDQPISIYEVHLGSWKRAAYSGDGARQAAGEPSPFLSYDEIAAALIPYAKEMGFTHLELLPVTEHPFDGSWGYQTNGYFAPTSRFGMPDDFRRFVDAAHQAGLGVILDWVPGHFPMDAHGLGFFDGTHLYEHADPRRGVHQDWGTYIYNYGRPQVRAFLLSSALFWLDRYHIDGLRVDAVASMLYLDYSRKAGEWLPNVKGGREDLDAVAFLTQFNELIHREYPGVLTFAEESTSWPGVTKPVEKGGLGFDLKWNMGWMNDSLVYMKHDPLLRKGVQNALTFSLQYAFDEKYLLPLSHDEVVHEKGSLAGKMPGAPDLQLANLRALLCWQFFHPGKKLLFMGGEWGQMREWNFDGELSWELLEEEEHARLRETVRALNALYQKEKALHQVEGDWAGFEWIDFSDAARSVISFLRRGKKAGDFVVVALNFTPVEWKDYRIGVPEEGEYRALFDSRQVGKAGRKSIKTEKKTQGSLPYSVVLDVPPLGAVVLKRAKMASRAKESETSRGMGR